MLRYAAIGTLLFTATAALTARLAPTAQRRRDACILLTILVRNRSRDDELVDECHR